MNTLFDDWPYSDDGITIEIAAVCNYCGETIPAHSFVESKDNGIVLDALRNNLYEIHWCPDRIDVHKAALGDLKRAREDDSLSVFGDREIIVRRNTGLITD